MADHAKRKDGEATREQAEYLARPILEQCGCAHYPGKEPCRHQRMFDDRVAWFMAGAAWERERGN